MKKLIIMILSAVLCFSLAACGGDEGEEAEVQENAVEDTQEVDFYGINMLIPADYVLNEDSSTDLAYYYDKTEDDMLSGRIALATTDYDLSAEDEEQADDILSEFVDGMIGNESVSNASDVYDEEINGVPAKYVEYEQSTDAGDFLVTTYAVLVDDHAIAIMYLSQDEDITDFNDAIASIEFAE